MGRLTWWSVGTTYSNTLHSQPSGLSTLSDSQTQRDIWNYPLRDPKGNVGPGMCLNDVGWLSLLSLRYKYWYCPTNDISNIVRLTTNDLICKYWHLRHPSSTPSSPPLLHQISSQTSQMVGMWVGWCKAGEVDHFHTLPICYHDNLQSLDQVWPSGLWWHSTHLALWSSLQSGQTTVSSQDINIP